MALSKNPTKTRTIENNWLREIKRRWKRFGKNIDAALIKLASSNVVTNADLPPGYEFDLNPEQQRIYMAFVLDEIDSLLMGTDEAPNWQAEYQICFP